MVSYIDHPRVGPQHVPCGCGGARAPIPIEQIKKMQEEEAAKRAAQIAAIQAGNYTIPTSRQQTINKNVDIVNRVVLNKPQRPDEGKTDVPKKIEEPRKVQELNITKVVENFNLRNSKNIISLENSHNKLHSPSRGGCSGCGGRKN